MSDEQNANVPDSTVWQDPSANSADRPDPGDITIHGFDSWGNPHPLSPAERTMCQRIAKAWVLRTLLNDTPAVDSIARLFRHFEPEQDSEDPDAFLKEAEDQVPRDRELIADSRKMYQVSLSEISKATALIPLMPDISADEVDEMTHDFQEVFGEVYDRDLDTYFNEYFETTMYQCLHTQGWFEHYLGRAMRWRQRRRDDR